MRVDLELESRVVSTPRVMQMAGIFDVPATERSRVEFHLEVPLEAQPWRVGLIVGPSGAGKSSVARAMFGDALRDVYPWPDDRAIVDGFSSPIRETTEALCAVGFASPPSWVRPYKVLSNGERFRANLARALLDESELVVVDEFTSVVDRQVAQVGSHALQKAIRRDARERRFVAVTCHYDVLEWLQPDWVLEPHTGRFVWRSQRRRPEIPLTICRAHSKAWPALFAPHHYLGGSLNHSAWCFVALYRDEPVAFDSWLPFVGRAHGRLRRGHKSVTLPDYQGLGIGSALIDTVASWWRALGFRPIDTTAHPGLIAARRRSPNWRVTAERGLSKRDVGTSELARRMAGSRAFARLTASFEYVGPPGDRAIAERMTHR